MTGKPWEKYQGAEAAPAVKAKPWEKYQAATPAPAAVTVRGNPAAAVGQAVRGAAELQPAAEPAGLYGAFAKRGAELGGDFLQFFDTIGRAPVMPEFIYEKAGLPVPPPAPAGSTWLGQAGNYLQGLSDSVNFQPRAPFESIGPAFENEGVMGGLGTLGRFLLEQGATSVPDMAAAVAAPWSYGAALTQGIAETRAENNQSGDATVEDLLSAAPAAAVSAFLDRYGGLGVFKGVGGKTPVGRVLGAGWREAWTEFLQEQAQYAGETVGTAKPWDVEDSLMRGAAGAVGGAGLGGAGRGAVEVIEAVAPSLKPQQPATVPIPVQGNAPGTPTPPPPPSPAAANLALGQPVGLRTPNARGGIKIVNAVPERVEGDVVFWRDEDGVMNTDTVQDFMRDAGPPAPSKKPPAPTPPPEFTETAPPPVVADPMAGAEPVAAPAPRQPRAVPLLTPAAAPVAPKPAASQQASYDQQGGNVPLLRRAVQTWDENIYKAERAVEQGVPSAKTPDEIAFMHQAREEAAGRLAGAMAAQSRGLAAQGTAAEAATTRVQQGRAAENLKNQEQQAAEADAAMQRVGRLPRPVAPQTAADLESAARAAPQTQRLTDWIVGRGGMRDPGGDLRAMDLQRRPGFIRKPRQAAGDLMGQRRGIDPLNPDYVREAAVEAGYLPEGATTADLYDAISADLRGQGPVQAADVQDRLDADEAMAVARQADRFENMYGQDPLLADLRYDADRAGVGWDSDATADDLRAAIDERLALMDAASVDEAERMVADAEDRAAEILGAEWDADAETVMEEETDAEFEPAVEDRAAATEDGQAGREAAEGDLAQAGEPGTEGAAVDERAGRRGGEEAAAGDGSRVLESVEGAAPDQPSTPGQRPVRRGRDAMNRRVAAERRRERRSAERAASEGRGEKAPAISAEEEAEIQSFTNFLGEKLLEGVGLDITVRPEADTVLGNFDPAQNIITVFRGAVDRGMFSRTMMHELWHAMESNLAPEARQTVIGEWRRQAERYMRRQDWMQAFAEREQDGSLLWVASSLPADDTAAFMATQYGQRAVAVGAVVLRTGGDGKARAHINWTRDNYRLHNASEFFAEAMTDRFEAMREGMDAFAGSVFEFMRAVWDRIVAGLRRLFGADVMADVFNGFRDGAVTVPEQPLPPIYEQVLEGAWALGADPDAGPDRPLGSGPNDEVGLQQLQVAATGPTVKDNTPFRIGMVMKYLVQGTWLASRSKEFAQLYQAQLDQHYLETRLIHDGGEATAKTRLLNDKQKKTANAIFEVARLAGINIVPTGRRLVVQVPQVGVGGLTMEPALSKPGDVLIADMETTEAVTETAAWLQQAWFQFWGGKAMNAGYKGEFTAPGIAQAKADAIAAKDRAAERLAEFAQELYDTAEQNQRDGYIPFMRYGDTALIVKDKSVPAGENPVVYMTLVDTTTGLGKLRSGKKQHKNVARKLKELQAQYAGANYEIEITRPGERDVDALDLPVLDRLMIAARLDRPAAAVKDYQALLNLQTTAEKEMFKDIAGGIPQVARRKIIDEIKNGILKQSRNVPGYETDFIGRSLLDYNRAMAGMVAKSALRDRVEAGQRAVYGDRETKKDAAHPTVVAWTKKWESYIDGPENNFFRHGRFLGFYMNMFGSLSSAMVNVTSTMTVTFPQLQGWNNRALADLTAAMRYGVRGVSLSLKRGAYVGIDKLGAPPALQAALKQAEAEGILAAGLTADLYGKVEAKYDIAKKGGKGLQAWLEIGASMFNYAEQYNRVTAYIAAWNAAQRPGARQAFMKMHGQNARVQEMVRERGLTPETIAAFFVEDTQFIPGQIDRSSILRGAGGLVFQFKQYMLNYLRLLGENLFRQGWKGKIAGLTMLLTMVYLSGLMGLPGLEDMMLLVQTVVNLIDGSGWSAEGALRELMAEWLGSPLNAELALQGFSREMLGVDLSSRIGIGRLTPEMEDPLMSIPLVAATWGRIEEAGQRFRRGEEAGGTVALLSPFVGKGVADFLRGAWVLDSEGYITRSGTQKFAPSDITWGEKLLQMAGLRPARFARTLEYDYAQRRIATQMSGPRGALMDQLANAGYNAQRARANGDEEAALAFEEELVEAWDAAWAAYTDPSTPPERLVKPPEWRDVMRAIQDRESEFSRLKRAPKLAREAMQDIPYLRE